MRKRDVSASKRPDPVEFPGYHPGPPSQCYLNFFSSLVSTQIARSGAKRKDQIRERRKRWDLCLPGLDSQTLPAKSIKKGEGVKQKEGESLDAEEEGEGPVVFKGKKKEF